MATLKNEYTVNPDYQAAFDVLQKETIDFMRSNDKVNISIIQTIQQLQHLMLIAKLLNKAQPVAATYQEYTPSSSNVNALITITATSCIVEDIGRIIEIYCQHFYTMDRINSNTSKNLAKLATQDVSDDKDMQWYREFLQSKKTEAAGFTEEVRALKSLSEIAIAHGVQPEVVTPKVVSIREEVLSEPEKVGSFFLVCTTIVVYILYNAFDASKDTVQG